MPPTFRERTVTPVNQETRRIFEQSLRRCTANNGFLDLFYDTFLVSSPKVREKFADTDFDRQKKMLERSLQLILWASEDPESGPKRYLEHMAERHSSRDLDVGSDLYDLWLDSLLATVRECDPEFDEHVEVAWERVMELGIDYMVRRYR